MAGHQGDGGCAGGAPFTAGLGSGLAPPGEPDVQPKVALDTDRIVGPGALLWWQHQLRGMTKETGLIVPTLPASTALRR